MQEALGPNTKEYFELLFNVVPSAIFAVDKDRRVTRWNKKAEEITGYSSGEMIGKECIIFTEHPCKDKCGLFSDDVGKPIIAKRCTIKRKDGQLRTVLKNADLLRNEKGNVIGGIESFEDITDLKQMEERLRVSHGELELRVKVRTAELTKANEELCGEVAKHRRAKEMLKESEIRYRAIVEDQAELICRFLPNGIITFVNGAYCRYFGKSQDELIGKSFMPLIPKDEHEKVEANLATLNIEHPVMMHEHRVIAADGSIRWQQWTNRAIFNKEGQFVEFQSTGRDVTERKQAEEELKKSREHLEVLNRELLNSNKRLKQLSLMDPHTGLYNHRYLEDVIEAEFYRARRYAHALAVIMVDIDYFKSINDVYGLQFGDLVLKQFAKQLKRMVRRYDIVIRFGGEEFIILSPGTDRPQTLVLAQRLLDALNLCNFGDKKHSVKLKLSFAVVSYPEDRIAKGADLINIADRILNKAKESGGNRVYSSEDLINEKNHAAARTKESSEVKLLKNKLEKLTKRANQSLMEAIFAFAKTIELKDHYTGEHVENTVRYATEIARELNLSREEIDLVKQASMLHDLGKIGISENILLKKSKLTKKEFEEIRKHPQIGADIIRPIHFLHPLIPYIFYHHEHWDGKGYPTGIKGEEIPVGARIIAIADVYQALTSVRPYRKAFSKPEAIKIIKNGSGTQFDPTIVSALLKILKQNKH